MAVSSIPERPEHRAVAAFLNALDGTLLARHGVVFGGGSRISLGYGEYRISRDADFLAADRLGYATLRGELRESGGIARLLSDASRVELPREARIDQYGIRFPVRIEGVQLKVEFIAEGRIALAPGQRGPFSDVPWASVGDCYSEKLLANSDRWADDAYLSRDLIDLAALRLNAGPVPEASWQKAEAAYGPAVVRDLDKAARAFLRDDVHRKRCFERLGVRESEGFIAPIGALRDEASARLGVS